jgi:hypothetical protein
MEEFGCSQEVATLGLSLFVIGLAIGPMVVSPLSEVRLTIHYPLQFLTPILVLWSPAYLHPIHGFLPRLVDSLRRCSKHTNDARSTFLQRLIRECFPQCRRWDCGGFVCTGPNPGPHDVIHNRSFPGTRSWASARWVHQPVHLMVSLTISILPHILTHQQALVLLHPPDLGRHNPNLHPPRPRNLPPHPTPQKSRLPPQTHK